MLTAEQIRVFEEAKDLIVNHILLKNPFPAPDELSKLRANAWSEAEQRLGIQAKFTDGCQRQVCPLPMLYINVALLLTIFRYTL